jgi:hypothetical protein
MLLRFARQFFSFLCASIAAHQALHMMGGAVQGDHEQVVLGRFARNSSQRPHFGIAQFTA